MAQRLYAVIKVDEFSEKNIIKKVFSKKATPANDESKLLCFKNEAEAKEYCKYEPISEAKQSLIIVEIDAAIKTETPATTQSETPSVLNAGSKENHLENEGKLKIDPDCILSFLNFINPKTEKEEKLIPSVKYRKLQILKDFLDPDKKVFARDVIKVIEASELPMLFNYLKKEFDIKDKMQPDKKIDEILNYASKDLIQAYIGVQKKSLMPSWPKKFLVPAILAFTLLTAGIGPLIIGLVAAARAAHKYFNPDYFQEGTFDFAAAWAGQYEFLEMCQTDREEAKIKSQSKKSVIIDSYQKYLGYLESNQDSFHYNDKKIKELAIVEITQVEGTKIGIKGSKFEIKRWKEREARGKVLIEKAKEDLRAELKKAKEELRTKSKTVKYNKNATLNFTLLASKIKNHFDPTLFPKIKSNYIESKKEGEKLINTVLFKK